MACGLLHGAWGSRSPPVPSGAPPPPWSVPHPHSPAHRHPPSPPLQTMPYRLDESTGLIDYDALEKSAALFRPKLIVAGEGVGLKVGWGRGWGWWGGWVGGLHTAAQAFHPHTHECTHPPTHAHHTPLLPGAGASAYTRHYDYPRMRAIADKAKASISSRVRTPPKRCLNAEAMRLTLGPSYACRARRGAPGARASCQQRVAAPTCHCFRALTPHLPPPTRGTGPTSSPTCRT